jgi:tRNA dimethylallyltransferase
MEKRQKIVVIAGPTASGKTSLSVKLALELGAEVVNADSMQVYRGMNIGTAKPDMEERKGVVHHLLDVVAPDEEFDAAIYRSLAIPILKEIDAKGKLGLVVGGTGLYLKTLLGGLLSCPPKDSQLRASLREECETRGSLHLHDRLRRVDPETAERIHPNDWVRITRALEIITLTGRTPSELSRAHGFRDRALEALKICLDVKREELYRRIDDRSEAMVEAGLIEETEALLKKGFSPGLKPMKALGYRHMVGYLKGDCSIEEAVAALKRDTRRYAKRQLTWFRADTEYLWIEPKDFNVIVGKVVDLVRETA